MKLIRRIFIVSFFIWMTQMSVISAHAKNVVVVIDPGHGGENLGGHTDRFVEQELTIEVAKAMKERLSMYDNVDIYLTHEEIGKKDLSRSERADIAAKYNADFMYSLHFNMSENNNLYGAEVWTSAFGEYYSKGQEFAGILMDGLVNELGFFDRGVKTRLGKTGDDYYGIILGGKKKKIPTVIIEHCHMDEERDYSFLLNNEKPYKTLGYLDADAVAKYFRLSSEALGIDYSDYERRAFEVPIDVISPDTSEPEYCNAKLLEFDEDNFTAKIEISAKDSDGVLQYYTYSYDGGKTYEKLFPWSDDILSNKPDNKEVITADVELLSGEERELIVRAYNRYDLYTESDAIILPAGTKPESNEELQKPSNYEEISYKLSDNNLFDGNKNIIIYVIIFILLVMLIITMTVVLNIINRKKRRKRRKRR